MGGDRHHPIVVALAEGLAAAGVAALRLDLLDPDFAAASETLAKTAGALRAEVDVDQLFLVGYSWGSVVTARTSVDGLTARVLIAPPISHVQLPTQPERALVLVPAHDQYGPPDQVDDALSSWPDATIEVIDGCDHFLAGATGRITDRAVSWLTA
jgi:pimeloyl-ACP methyl ester carboxylesterase